MLETGALQNTVQFTFPPDFSQRLVQIVSPRGGQRRAREPHFSTFFGPRVSRGAPGDPQSASGSIFDGLCADLGTFFLRFLAIAQRFRVAFPAIMGTQRVPCLALITLIMQALRRILSKFCLYTTDYLYRKSRKYLTMSAYTCTKLHDCAERKILIFIATALTTTLNRSHHVLKQGTVAGLPKAVGYSYAV